MKYNLGDKVYFFYNKTGRTFVNDEGIGIVTRELDDNYYQVTKTHTVSFLELQKPEVLTLYYLYLKPLDTYLDNKIEYFKEKIDTYQNFKKEILN